MICRKCGKYLEESARFCDYCGTPQPINPYETSPYAPLPKQAHAMTNNPTYTEYDSYVQPTYQNMNIPYQEPISYSSNTYTNQGYPPLMQESYSQQSPKKPVYRKYQPPPSTPMPFQKLRIVINIIAFILCLPILFTQFNPMFLLSIHFPLSNSGTCGFILSLIWIFSGIISLAGTKSYGMTLFSGIAYLFAGIIVLPYVERYQELMIWGSLSLVFGVFFIICCFVYQTNKGKQRRIWNRQRIQSMNRNQGQG